MSRADVWAGNIKPMSKWDFETRSMDTARLINSDPKSIALIRDDVLLSPQTVFITPYRHPVDKKAENNWNVSLAAVVIIGYKNHPTIPDTNIQRDDTFKYGNQLFVVINFLSSVRDRIIVVADVSESGGA